LLLSNKGCDEGIMNIEVVIYTLSIVAAVNFLFVGIIGHRSFHTEGNHVNATIVSNVFLALSFIGFWYTASLAIIESDFIAFNHNFAGISMLVSGYLGPLIFIFTMVLAYPYKHFPKKVFLLVLVGLPGTVYSLMYLMLPAELATTYYLAFKGGNAVDMGVLSHLFLMHTGQQAIFLILSLILATYTVFRKASLKSDNEPVKVFMVAVFAAILTLVVSNLLPVVMKNASLSRLGPVLTLPSFLIVMKALNIYKRKIHHTDLQRKSLAKYLSPQVIDTIFNNNDEVVLGGEVAEASILFIDIRGFTKMSEQRNPNDVVNYLNAYLEKMNNVIFDNCGMIDKFIGDAILVVFGVPNIDRNHRLDALNCAVDMLKQIDVFNKENVMDDYELKVGIGIHTGDLLHGNVGCGRRVDYTVIGDVVNTASRLESLTKEYDTPVIFTDSTLNTSKIDINHVECLGECMIRGKADRVKIYSFLNSNIRINR